MRFLGIDVAAVSPGRAEKIIAEQIEGTAPCAVMIHANLNTAYSATRDARLREALEHPGSVVLFEGIGLKLARWLTSGEWQPDANGTDLVPAVLRRLAHRPLRLVLVGGREGVATQAGAELERRFPFVKVVGAWNGYGARIDEEHLLEAIRTASPDIVLLGLGTPIQERLAVSWAARSGAKVIWAVGGLLDYTAGVRLRAPRLMRGLRLEWLWRLALYPRAYGRRYALQGAWLCLQVLRIWTGRLCVSTRALEPPPRDPFSKPASEPGEV